MKTYDEMDFHPEAEKLVAILCSKTQNTNPLFFRVMVAYYFSLVASMMRCKINTKDRGDIPVNMYAINLATSGSGKGLSANVIEEQVIDQFQHNFVNSTLPLMAAKNLPSLAHARASRHGRDPDEELVNAEAEYTAVGPMFFSFDSGTAPAIKDVRHKLLMANGGALNLQIDEIGTHLTGSLEVLAPYLELFDVGKLKQKLTKNTADNKRREEIIGRTPANMMLYGTPTRVFNGGKTEDEFYTLLDTGYARRCFFGYAKGHMKNMDMTPQEVFDLLTSNTSEAFLQSVSDRLGDLADMSHAYTSLEVSKPVTLLFIEYKIQCEKLAEEMGEHEEMRKAELSHRYFKAMKLAGAYAFIDGVPEITEDHAYYAIKLAEMSGKAFELLLTRDRPHVRLAKYIAQVQRPITQSDLIEDLPFYKGSTAQKQEMLMHAIAYGYQNNILIKTSFEGKVEFLHGETLKAIDLDAIKVSYSEDIAVNYLADTAKFDDLHKLTAAPGMHWCTHAFKGGHRAEDDAIPGFNIVVLDVDSGVDLSTAMGLLKDYKALYYTTKRHTEKDQRFRIVLPINFELSLDSKDFKEFMSNIYQWLPFAVDDGTGQRARKWLSNPGKHTYVDGQVLDVLPFIPKTSKNQVYKDAILDQSGMDNLERWVINNSVDGNRNKILLRYAMILVDADFDFVSINSRVGDLNNKLDDPLPETEILQTIMVTVTKAIAAK